MIDCYAMNRRELLKGLSALHLSTMRVNGRPILSSLHIGRKMVTFVDETAFPIQRAKEMAMLLDEHLSLETLVIPVCVPPGKSIDEVIRAWQGY
jgi:hypothetical protein